MKTAYNSINIIANIILALNYYVLQNITNVKNISSLVKYFKN